MQFIQFVEVPCSFLTIQKRLSMWSIFRLPNFNLIVKSVEENSPASKAGLRVADHIIRVRYSY